MTTKDRGLVDFAIVGAPKAGSTSVADVLRRHPRIDLPMAKELNFFFRDDCGTRLDEYRALFDSSRANALHGDADPWYLASELAAANLARFAPSVRLIFLLRDPVERARSHYLMRFARGTERRSFSQALADELAGVGGDFRANYLVNPARYYRHISRFLDCFPREQLLFVRFRDLISNGRLALRTIQEHIGVEAIDLHLPRSNAATQPRSRFLHQVFTAPLRRRWAGRSLARRVLSTELRQRAAGLLLRANQSFNRVPGSSSLVTISPADMAILRQELLGDSHLLAELLELDLSNWQIFPSGQC